MGWFSNKPKLTPAQEDAKQKAIAFCKAAHRHIEFPYEGGSVYAYPDGPSLIHWGLFFNHKKIASGSETT